MSPTQFARALLLSARSVLQTPMTTAEQNPTPPVASPENLPQDYRAAQSAGLQFTPVAVGIWLLFAVVTVVLIAAGRRSHPLLHTSLDTAVALTAAVLAVLLWDI